jgi:amino acid permease
MSYPFGRIGSTFVLVNMLVLAYGAMVAYLLIIKDTIPTILGIAHGNMDNLLEHQFLSSFLSQSNGIWPPYQEPP